MASMKSNSENYLDSVSSEEFLNLDKNKNKRKRFLQAKYPPESGSDSKKKLKTDYVPPELGKEESSSREEFTDGYDDQLMGDEKDRARLASLTEKEREMEIFNRTEKREFMKTKFKIEKKLRQAEDKLSKPKGENKEVAHKLQMDFSLVNYKEISEQRQKNIGGNRGKRVNALAELKAERQEKIKRVELGIEREKREDRRKKSEDQILFKKNGLKLKSSDIYSDDNEDDKSGTISCSLSSSNSKGNYNDKKKEESSASQPYKNVLTRQDLNPIRLSRHKLERFVHMPFFDRIAKGCYVKVGIAEHNNIPVYRVAEVIGVERTAKTYNLGKTKTNKGLKVRHGNHEQVFRLEFVSNKEFSDPEFLKWIEASAAAGNDLPSKSKINQKQADILEAINYEFTEQDVSRIIQEKHRFKSNPINYAMKKMKLMNERESAMSRGDEKAARKLRLELTDLEERATKLDKLRTSTISNISYINNINRRKNIEEAEKAIMAEMRANKGKNIEDPFTRRSTRPRMYFKAGEKEVRNAALSKAPAELKVEQQPDTAKEQAQGTSQDLADLFSAHDFDIAIDFQESLAHDPVNIVTKSITNRLAPKRCLSLQDYKKARGLI